MKKALKKKRNAPKKGKMQEYIERETFEKNLSQWDSWHLPVLLESTVEAWSQAKQKRFFVDGTVGGGGHTNALLERLPEAKVLGIDRDPDALHQASGRLEVHQDRFVSQLGSYAELSSHLAAVGFPEQVDGILVDLGVNSSQLDLGDRGFSFRFGGPLDMRFNQQDDSVPTAADLVNKLPLEELVRIFRDWGEERRAVQAARAILNWREEQPFETTDELHSCLHPVLFSRKKNSQGKKTDPTTRCFQALRIEVNQELEQLDVFLKEALDCLVPGGRLALISFHSLEDRRVKIALRKYANPCICPSDFPICACGKKPVVKLLTRRPIMASEQELIHNPRARSARLRVAEKIS